MIGAYVGLWCVVCVLLCVHYGLCMCVINDMCVVYLEPD